MLQLFLRGLVALLLASSFAQAQTCTATPGSVANGRQKFTVTGPRGATVAVTYWSSSDMTGSVGSFDAVIGPDGTVTGEVETTFTALSASCTVSSSTTSCTHVIEGLDTFGDGWNGASLEVNNLSDQFITTDITVLFSQTSTIFGASPGDTLETTFFSGAFDNEIIYNVYGGDSTPSGGFPSGCNLLGSDGPFPVGLAGLPGDCSGSGPCPLPPLVFPSNDDCSDAIDLGGAYQTVDYDLFLAMDGQFIDYTGFCDFGSFGDEMIYSDVWYIFTPENDGCHYMSTLGLAGFDTRLAVHESDSCPTDGSTVIACVDDEVQPIVLPLEAGMDVNLSAGTRYYIQLGTFSAGTFGGPGSLLIDDGSGTQAEDNDPSGQNLFNPSGCVVDTGFPEFCNGDGGDGMGCTDCPCGNNANPGTIGGCLNSGGTSPRLLGSGTPTATGSNLTPPLRFECAGIAPSNSCQLTSGNAAAPANAANPCFGLNSGITSVSLDGLRCAVQGVLRHGVRPADANGDVGVTTNGWGGSNNFFNYTAFSAGQTKFFQVIHRDDAGAGCLTGQNTTQLIEIVFEP